MSYTLSLRTHALTTETEMLHAGAAAIHSPGSRKGASDMESMLKTKAYTTIDHCRICRSTRLLPVVRFEPQFIGSTFVKTNKDHPKAQIKIPMTLLLCQACGLVQLRETTRPDLLYEDYFYRSNVSNTMRMDLQDVVISVLGEVRIASGDAVLDIGCNDGLMLSMFPSDLERVGIDPAKNIDWSHLEESVEVINDYFPSNLLEGRSFKVITTTAMFYDLDDPNHAAAEVKRLLAKDGVLCIQVSYLCDTIKDMNFYDICHEHLAYYSLSTLSYLMQRNGLEVFDASTNAVNGGSLRVLVAHKEAKRKKSKNLESLLARESVFDLENPATYDTFSKLIKLNAARVKEYIQDQVNDSRLVIGLGASTKGNVLLQIAGITRDLLPYISERSPVKVGLRTLGTDIELISEEAARKMNPAVMFVIPWNFKAEIVQREHEYLDSGGKLLFVMPYPYLIDRHGETQL